MVISHQYMLGVSSAQELERDVLCESCYLTRFSNQWKVILLQNTDVQATNRTKPPWVPIFLWCVILQRIGSSVGLNGVSKVDVNRGAAQSDNTVYKIPSDCDIYNPKKWTYWKCRWCSKQVAQSCRRQVSTKIQRCSKRIYQEVPDTPTAVMGLQVTPTRPVTSWTTTPRRARRPEIEALSAVCVLSQHWRDPVLHWLLWRRVGVAAARVARARVAKAESLEYCMLDMIERVDVRVRNSGDFIRLLYLHSDAHWQLLNFCWNVIGR